MANSFFRFKQFTVQQEKCAMKVTTDACLFGAWIAEEIKSRGLSTDHCLDIGTGTGLLPLMIIQKNPSIFFDAIEIDKDSAKHAKENISSSPWSGKINIHKADVKYFLFEKKYDIIISNPPFYEKELKSESVSKNIAHHSDELKLDELLNVIKSNLSKDGNFFLLLPFKRNEEIKKLIQDHSLHINNIVFIRQSFKHNYFRIILTGAVGNNNDEETNLDEISIWNEKNEYTPEFTTLLKDYYLYL